ncbi:hypothetical protein I2W78_16165 [Streptomyces spinoverrucosus]|uniref:hypothetical protein n=1 Tax=Streptomyces spinoverrucosus TaxID=284043 RepID=UPI0018C39FFE|nr:hypothetical protein [Streptomyces spinoverrucosus]MBG0853339.1 hypothetical protein [Streptomyces spinoverrucosus]
MTNPGTRTPQPPSPAPPGRRARFAAWYGQQDSGVKAAVIGFAGAVLAALIGAGATVLVVVIGQANDAGGEEETTPPSWVTSAPAETRPSDGTTPPESPPPTTDSPSPTPRPSSPSPEPGRASETAAAPPVPAEPRVRWQGTVILDGTAGVRGWFFDPVPPGRAPAGDLWIRGVNEVYGTWAIAAWRSAGPPDRAECVALLNTHLGDPALDVQVGDRACFATENRRIGSFEVTDIPDADHIQLAVTVWEGS